MTRPLAMPLNAQYSKFLADYIGALEVLLSSE